MVNVSKATLKWFKWVKKSLSKFNEDFIKKYNEDCNKGYFLEVDIDLPFLPERKKVEKVEKLICSIKERKICCSQKSFKTRIMV